jgi:hypothetical protein
MFQLSGMDPAAISSLGTDAQSFYSQRDTRMDDEQQLYEMQNSSTAPVTGGQTMTINDGRVLVMKPAAMLANKPPRVRGIGGAMPEQHAARMAANLCMYLRREFARRYQNGVRNPLAYDEAQSILLRGWVVGRLLYNPSDPQFPFVYDLLDPIHVYPRLGGKSPLYIAHVQDTTVGDILGDWGDIADTLMGDRDPKEPVKMTGIYTPLEYAIVVDNDFLVQPTQHGYGFNPIIISTAAGAFYRATPNAPDFTEFMGAGILSAVKGPIADKEELMAMLKTLIAKQANPPWIMKTDTPSQVSEPDTEAGGITQVGRQDDFAPMVLGPALNNLMALIQAVQDEIYRGALGPAAFAEGNKFTSGFHESIAAGTARDMIFPFVRALEHYYETLYNNAFTLFTMNAGQITVVAPQPGVGVQSQANPSEASSNIGAGPGQENLGPPGSHRPGAPPPLDTLAGQNQ